MLFSISICYCSLKESESESCSVLSDSLRSHGLYSPWNSPGQNTEVGSSFLLRGIFPTQGLNPGFPHCRQILYQLSHRGSPIALCILYIFCFSLWFIFSPKSQFSFLLSFSICSVMSDFLRPHGLYSLWNSPGQSTGVDSLSLLQGIFPTQGLNPGLSHCRRILYQLSFSFLKIH